MERSLFLITAGKAIAQCKLLRDVQVGEQVVVGVEGIRTVRKPEAREQRQEFSFMGAGVSSERRVELVVDQIAWDLRRIRDQGGKVVVVSGTCGNSYGRWRSFSALNS